MEKGSLRLSSCNFLPARPPLCPFSHALFPSLTDIENIFKREVEFSIGSREQFRHGTKRKRVFRPASPLEKFFPAVSAWLSYLPVPVQFQARTRRGTEEWNGIDVEDCETHAANETVRRGRSSARILFRLFLRLTLRGVARH